MHILSNIIHSLFVPSSKSTLIGFAELYFVWSFHTLCGWQYQMAKTQAKKPANKSSNQNDNRPMGMSKITEEDENKAQDPDEEINSGFGSYMRSSEGQ